MTGIAKGGFTPLETRPPAQPAGRLQPPRGGLALTGFTLIELLVSVAIFSLLLLIVLSIFSRFVLVQRRDIGEQALQEDLRFALEMFNREVRTGFGSTYQASGDGAAVTFRNQAGTCVEYRRQGSSWVRAAATEFDLSVDCASLTYNAPEPLLSPSSAIEQLQFTVQTAEYDDVSARLTKQGFITVSVIAQAAQKADRPVALQSTVTSRQVSAFGVTPQTTGNNAECVDLVDVPNEVAAGTAFDVSIIMRNSSETTSWGGNHRLGSQNPQDNQRWGVGRISLPVSVADVPPGAEVTFTETLTAPADFGAFSFSWRMVEEGREWFGQTCEKRITVE